jgi:isopropylmalate/homocitrate/citramalate synthase
VVPFLIEEIKKTVDKPLETHFHNDFGLATANTVMAVAAGAEIAHVTVGGTGERAGNASLEEVATILLTMYGIDAGLKTEKFYELVQMVRKLGNVPIQPSKPLIGDGIFNIESGMVAMFLVNCGMVDVLELYPFHWSLVGNHEPTVVLGKKSGKDSVKLRLDKLCQNLSEEQILKAVDLIKEKSFAKKDLITDDEFEEVLEEVRSM